MAIVAEPKLMITEEFLALPDDGVERWLINGRLRELSRSEDSALTVRNRWHSEIMACVVDVLRQWLKSQPKPRGKVLCGEAGFRVRQDPDITVGIDVAYVSAAPIR